MFSFDPATKLMYTCDAFGSHYCSEDMFDTDLSAVMPHYRFYYEVGRCRLTVSKPVLKAPTVSALETRI